MINKLRLTVRVEKKFTLLHEVNYYRILKIEGESYNDLPSSYVHIETNDDPMVYVDNVNISENGNYGYSRKVLRCKNRDQLLKFNLPFLSVNLSQRLPNIFLFTDLLLVDYDFKKVNSYLKLCSKRLSIINQHKPTNLIFEY